MNQKIFIALLIFLLFAGIYFSVKVSEGLEMNYTKANMKPANIIISNNAILDTNYWYNVYIYDERDSFTIRTTYRIHYKDGKCKKKIELTKDTIKEIRKYFYKKSKE